MTTENTTTTSEDAGPIGMRLAEALTAKVIETIDGFPDSTPEQRAAIAQLVAGDLHAYVVETREA